MSRTHENKKPAKKVVAERSKSKTVQHVPAQQPALPPLKTGEAMTAEGILALQRTAGNRAVTTMLAQSAGGVVQREVKGSKAFKKKFGEAEKVLNNSETGKQALAVVTKYKIDVKEGAAGGGSEYSASENAMKIDSTESSVDIALTFVHEVNHAKAYHEGKWADPAKLSRKEYIKAEINEEAEGTVKSIEAKMELEGTKIDVSKASFPLEKQYRRAYKAAVKKAKKKDPKKSAADLKAIGRKAGLARVVKGFYKGEVVISTSKKPVTYPKYYGNIWDKKNKKKK